MQGCIRSLTYRPATPMSRIFRVIVRACAIALAAVVLTLAFIGQRWLLLDVPAAASAVERAIAMQPIADKLR
jgi:hypothetical protein